MRTDDSVAAFSGFGWKSVSVWTSVYLTVVRRISGCVPIVTTGTRRPTGSSVRSRRSTRTVARGLDARVVSHCGRQLRRRGRRIAPAARNNERARQGEPKHTPRPGSAGVAAVSYSQKKTHWLSVHE
jgi:hypothetical protein